MGIKFPTPWKTLIIKFPPPRDGKGVKCPRYARGGGMLKLRFDRYINVRNTPTSRTMNLKLCKFPRVLLTRFPLVQRQSATVTAHTRAQSWHSPFKTKFNSLFYKMILITKTNPTPFEEISLQELNKLLQKFYLSARKIVARGCSEQGSFCMSMPDRWTSDVHGGSPQGLPSS